MISNGEWNGFLLHAGAVATPQGALVFTGRSGAGKSTLCKILEPRFKTISDDCVCILYSGNGQWRVEAGRHHTWRIWTTCSKPPVPEIQDTSSGVPLLGIMPIQQAQHTSFTRLDSRTVSVNLLKAVLEVGAHPLARDTIRLKKWFRLCVRVSQDVSGCHFGFPKSSCVMQEVAGFAQKISA
jgi:energy-coupling factor transporter ATP-binding protein EcfA2